MKAIFLICFLTVAITGYPQFGYISGKDANKIKGKETLVLLNGSLPNFNKYLKESVEKHWTFSKYRFIDSTEFAASNNLDKYTFISLISGEKSKINSQGDIVSYYEYMLTFYEGNDQVDVMHQKDETDGKVYPQWRIREHCKLTYFADWNERMVARNKADTSLFNISKQSLLFGIKQMNSFLSMAMEKDLPEKSDKLVYKELSLHKDSLKGKTLYIRKQDASRWIKSLSDFKSRYPYPVKIVEEKVIEDAILNHDSKIAFAKVLVGFDYLERKTCLISAATGEVLYANDGKFTKRWLKPLLK